MKTFMLLPFQPTERPLWYAPLGYAAAIGSVVLATALLWVARPYAGGGTVYLVYLVAVIWAAVGWGLRQAVLASVAAFLCANYFFTEPRFTFTVAASQDAVALVVFLGLATLSSQLVARLRYEAFESRRSNQLTGILYTLSESINRHDDLELLLHEAIEQLRSALGLTGYAISVSGLAGVPDITVHTGRVGPLPVLTPLIVGGKEVGVLMSPQPAGRRTRQREEAEFLLVFAEQLEVAVEHFMLRREALESEVLRRTDRLRVSMMAAVAHDLRTPLSTIKAAATTLTNARVSWSEEDRQKFLGSIVKEVDRINRFVTDLLEASRIEAGQLVLKKEPASVAALIESVLERLDTVLQSHPVDVQIDPGLPIVLMDVAEIDRALSNLLENASRHTPPGTPVHLSARTLGDSIEVEVADEGPGIAPDCIGHLFSSYYRAAAESNGKVGGMGLGLSIVKGIVAAHGGEVKAANRTGGGASFSFTLPVSKVEESKEPKQAQVQVSPMPVAASAR